jgi:hypothetical protein
MPAATPATNHNITKCEHYNIFRQYMMREDDLINHRLSWNLAIQGFLFASYAFSVQKLAEIHTKALVEKGSEVARQLANSAETAPLRLLIFIIPLVGLSMASFVWFAVLAAKMALEKLHTDWQHVSLGYPEQPYLPDTAGAGVPTAVRFGFKAPLWIQAIFIAAWVLLWLGYLLGWSVTHL